jgi:adenine deaminase
MYAIGAAHDPEVAGSNPAPYGTIRDQILKVAGFGEGARGERLHAYLNGVAVDGDREAESIEDATAKIRLGLQRALR